MPDTTRESPPSGSVSEKEEKSKSERVPSIPVPPEVLEKLPAKERREIESFLTMALSWGPSPNPLIQKITSEHVGQIIQGRARDSELEYADRKDSRRLLLAAFALGSVVSAIVVIVLSLWDKTDILNDLIKSGLIGLGGFGGGYGFAEWRRHRH